MWVLLSIGIAVLLVVIIVSLTMRKEPTGCILVVGGLCLLLLTLAIVSSVLMMA